MIFQLALVSCMDSFVIGINVNISIFNIMDINEPSVQCLI